MTRRWRLDLARLARENEHPSEDPYLAVGQMLRDHLGGDPLAELRERFRADPVLAEMAGLASDLLWASSPARRRRPRLTAAETANASIQSVITG